MDTNPTYRRPQAGRCGDRSSELWTSAWPWAALAHLTSYPLLFLSNLVFNLGGSNWFMWHKCESEFIVWEFRNFKQNFCVLKWMNDPTCSRLLRLIRLKKNIFRKSLKFLLAEHFSRTNQFDFLKWSEFYNWNGLKCFISIDFNNSKWLLIAWLW